MKLSSNLSAEGSISICCFCSGCAGYKSDGVKYSDNGKILVKVTQDFWIGDRLMLEFSSNYSVYSLSTCSFCSVGGGEGNTVQAV